MSYCIFCSKTTKIIFIALNKYLIFLHRHLNGFIHNWYTYTAGFSRFTFTASCRNIGVTVQIHTVHPPYSHCNTSRHSCTQSCSFHHFWSYCSKDKMKYQSISILNVSNKHVHNCSRIYICDYSSQ